MAPAHIRILRPDLVLTGRPGEQYAHGEVVVQGKTIIAVGPRGSYVQETPEGEPTPEIIDLPGRTLLPGLIDAHVHLGFDSGIDASSGVPTTSDNELLLRMAENARKLVSAGVTTAKDLGCRGFLDTTLRSAIESGMSIGPNLVLATRPITTTGGHCWYMGGEADTAEDIRRVARENFRGGADCLKVMATGGSMTKGALPSWASQYSTELVAVAVDEANARGKMVSSHAHGLEGIRESVDAGVHTLEHCTFAGPDGLFGADGFDEELVKRIAEEQIIVCPTVSGVIWNMGKILGDQWLDAWLARLGRMRELGVLIAAGTDAGFVTGSGFGISMDNYADGLDILSAAGWNAAQVIESATIIAARACGVADVTGTVEVGKRADLLAVNGNPLEGISALREVDLVLVSGRKVTQSNIDTVISSNGK